MITVILTLASLLAAPPRTVRDVRWMDRVYDIGGGDDMRFVAGHYNDLNEDGQCNVCAWIRDVAFGDVDGDGAEDAVVLMGSNLGGASTDLELYLYGLVNGAVVLKGTIEGGDRGDGGIQGAKVVGGEVVVRRFDVGEIDGACCPSRVLIERWRWVNGRLEQRPGPPRVERRPRRTWQLRP